MKERPEELEGIGFISYKTITFVVKKFIETCHICQKQSEGLEKLYIEPFVGSTYSPMERIQIDHIGPLPEDAYGNKHLQDVPSNKLELKLKFLLLPGVLLLHNPKRIDTVFRTHEAS